ncbi:MAG: cytochrome b/b6 domain-containing protein [Alphaproteobacteria bacterium]|nr:cytochrome b/b6 domain-containing protein [Alphaproteobacteria bacterium]
MADALGPVRHGRTLIRRHSALVRITHWINVVCLTVLLMSGLQIFNAHPALYWGAYSDFAHPVLSMTAEQRGDASRGITTVLGHRFDTTGVLGVSADAQGHPWARGFPAWATLPGQQALAEGRLWHFFFAWLFVLNGAVYLLAGLFGGHLWRDLVPSGRQLRRIGRTAWEHMLFRFPKGAEARRYNVLQQLAYLIVMFGVLPFIVLAGLAMSPRMDAAFPWLLDLFGGRQSARTVHFILAWLLVAFVLVHVFMVLVSGVWNNVRSMITGRYAIEEERDAAHG